MFYFLKRESQKVKSIYSNLITETRFIQNLLKFISKIVYIPRQFNTTHKIQNIRNIEYSYALSTQSNRANDDFIYAHSLSCFVDYSCVRKILPAYLITAFKETHIHAPTHTYMQMYNCFIYTTYLCVCVRKYACMCTHVPLCYTKDDERCW